MKIGKENPLYRESLLNAAEKLDLDAVKEEMDLYIVMTKDTIKRGGSLWALCYSLRDFLKWVLEILPAYRTVCEERIKKREDVEKNAKLIKESYVTQAYVVDACDHEI